MFEFGSKILGRHSGMGRWTRVRAMFMVAVFCSSHSGCLSPDEYREEADAEAYRLVAKAREITGQDADPEFTIDTPAETLRTQLLLPRSDDTVPGPRERLARTGVETSIDLATALAIAARNARDYQSEKERLYETALSFTGAMNRFESQYFGTIEAQGRSNGDGESDATLSLAENSSFGFTRMFETGGRMSLAIGQDLTRFFTNPADTVADSLVNLTISLPFLRGAGREVAFENVTQAERDVLYAVRRFERFKRQFAVEITTNYLRLLQNRNTVENELNNYKRRQETAKENRELGLAGRIARTDVERTNQAELAAENRWINARQSYENALDRFKESLSLPTDARIEIDSADLDRLVLSGVDNSDVNEEDTLVRALANRLDLVIADGQFADARRRVVVAADALKAGLDFTASVNLNTDDYANRSFKLDPLGDGDYSLGLLLDLPFERTDERNAYRSALIDAQAAKRNAEEVEDLVKLQVRQAMRDLVQARESYRIQLAAVEVAQINVDSARLLKDAGEGTTNDLLDAQNDLISAQNAATAALIDYTVARLELYRDMDILAVGDQGVDYELTQRRLKEE